MKHSWNWSFTLAAVIAQWHECIKGVEVTTRTLIDQWACSQTPATKDEATGDWTPRLYKNPEFREVLMGIAGSGDKVDSVRLGKWLRKNKDRLIGKQRLVQATGKTAGLVRWKLEGEPSTSA